MRDLAVDRQDDRRAIEGVDDFRRDDTDHAAVPSLACDDENRSRANLGIGLDDLPRLGDDVLFFLATLRVLGVELLGQAARLVRHPIVGCQQQACRDVGCAHAAGRVDPRRHHEGDVIAVDLLACKPGDFEQCTEADLVRSLRQHLQAELGDDAILTDQRHDVGQRADRGDLDEGWQPVGFARAHAQRLHELESDADAGEMLVGVRAIVPFRVDDRDRLRKFGVGLVMVRDDEIEAKLAAAACRLRTANAAVDRDDDMHALGVQAFERGRLESVAITQTLGNEMRHLAAEQLERAPQNHRGRDAVDVVVAVHGNAFAGIDRAQQTFDGTIHVGQAHRIEQVIQ